MRRLIWVMCMVACGGTQTPTSPPVASDAIPMTPARWSLSARDAEFVTHLGRPSLRLKGGFAFLRDVEFSDGVIELDMIAEPGVAFAGPVWRVQDESRYEKFYLRTFLSGSREATQYVPVFHHIAGWQIYHGPDFNQPVTFRPRRWTPVKIVVSGERADIYVQDMEQPLLHVDPLRLDETSGRVALYNEPIPADMNPASVYYSNVRVTSLEAPELRGQLREPAVERPGRVAEWAVSQPFDGETLDGQLRAPEGSTLTWQALSSEPSGLTDLARLHAADAGADTVFARVNVRSDRAQRVQVRFGFSERVRVFFRGDLVFVADDTWHSRDITFQGVIGWYDGLVLPLEEGDNELWFAVSENLAIRGGWGLQAAF
ncbi:MAG: hypothetical protein AAGE52_41520, partial [Myxococcota bacterium]